MTKIQEFDGIRAVAILCIVACHICYGINPTSHVGQYLGGTFNFVFFLLSGLLIGISVNSKKANNTIRKSKHNRWTFLKKRIKRLLPDLWIFITFFVGIAAALGTVIDPKALIMNYALLGWFYKLPYCGHLWFVTMIMLCYLLFALLLNVANRLRTCIVMLISCIVGAVFLEMKGLPSYMFIILFLSGLAMLYNREIITLMNKLNFPTVLLVTLATNIAFYIMIHTNILTIGNLNYYCMASLSGITMFVCLWHILKKFPTGKFLTLVSALSYQIYIVHHPLCNVNYADSITGNRFISILLICLTSLLLAYLLKLASDFILSLQKKHKSKA